MSVQATGRLVLQWTLRNATCPVLNLRTILRSDDVRQRGFMTCRLLCSTHNQTSTLHQHTDLSQLQLQPGRELSIRALLDMGFTDTQADQLLEAATKGRGGQSEYACSTLMALFVLGLNPSSVLKVLEKCPELFYVKGTQLQQRMDNLRRLGLLEGSLQRVVSHYPQILTLPLRRVSTVARFLREKCAFTVQQATDIIRDSPAVVQDDLGQLEYKFQYAYFRMGVKQAEMVKSKVFRVTLEEVRCRHSFLERRGLYQTPDKKGQTLIVNPKLKDILAVTEETYLADIAMATQEEFKVFQKLMAREWQEEDDEQERDMGADSDDDDEEDEDEEDMKIGYRQRRKK
ncbi:transcription termination factor 4, mitochondrial [Salvelinus namaycush]|uniref:Transcription termination factor 4, mitochondrial n=1 Tax=Salvelinus namaycush TaxID=8040 RepID=A0A8U0TJN5_SALNM|nr:transcription termination factor 4, mitochondrial [Salvelinus namaycush]